MTRVAIKACFVLALLIGLGFFAADDPPTTDAMTATSISAGLSQTCAVTPAGGIKCWGSGRFVQPYPLLNPHDVAGLTSGVQQVSVGEEDSGCAIVGGGARCWGGNGFGQLGDGSGQFHADPVDVFGLSSGVTSISVGNDYACAVVHGGVMCWGRNSTGQLGNGEDGPDTCNNHPCATKPVQVEGLTSGVKSVSIAPGAEESGTTCATMVSGGVKCWGSNKGGLLGIGTASGPESCPDYFVQDCSRSPVDVPGLADVRETTVGLFSNCAVSSGGFVQCWGENLYGELGDGTTTSSSSPVAVTGLPVGGLVSVAISGNVTCGRAQDSGAWCWGLNSSDSLGISDQTGPEVCPTLMSACSTKPVQVENLSSRLIDIASFGYSTCAVLEDGHIKCWGSDNWGEAGDANRSSKTPSQVVGLTSGVSAISASGGHACAALTSGVQCWGFGYYGELGTGEDFSMTPCNCSTLPVAVANLGSATSLSTGDSQSCAVVGGAAWCWGYDISGELGNGQTGTANAPVQVVGLESGVHSVASGTFFSCAVLNSGGARCWGHNDVGQHGDGTSQAPLATDVSGLTTAVASITASYEAACALTTSGGVKCWGGNSLGQLGVDPLTGPETCGSRPCRTTPMDIPGLSSGVAQVVLGDSFGCARTTGGAVKCWGSNAFGQLGTGDNSGPDTCSYAANFTFPCSHAAVDVFGLSQGVTNISAGADYACAVLADGGVRCWGNNTYGQLGDGLTSPSYVPEDVSGLSSGVDTVSAGESESCALTMSGGVKCWGNNPFGELGTGQFGNITLATDVVGFGGFETLSVPGDGSCDGQFNGLDVVSALSRVARAYSGHVCLGNMDVDCDNAVTLTDAILILKRLGSLITTFPCVS